MNFKFANLHIKLEALAVTDYKYPSLERSTRDSKENKRPITNINKWFCFFILSKLLPRKRTDGQTTNKIELKDFLNV